ncbi:MAG TPA: FxsA family protein [Mycobacteriales bacterium]|nr:FxsA family protein [Mycobacteriales bacterium]
MGLLLVLAFLVVPIAELYVIVQVGQAIGVLETIGLLLAVAFVGSWLVKREGLRTWSAFLAAMREHRVPAKEVADGALVILGGALLLTPGFVSDVVGLLLVLPPTRALVRGTVTARLARRMGVVDVRRR